MTSGNLETAIGVPVVAKVLLVEDNPINSLLACRLLEKRGHSVVSVTNGDAALKALENERYDLVLMDLQMPGLSGFETTQKIRGRETTQGSRTPIVAMTGRAMPEDRARCLEVGMDGYLTKPINPKEFFEVLERALQPGASSVHSSVAGTRGKSNSLDSETEPSRLPDHPKINPHNGSLSPIDTQVSKPALPFGAALGCL